MSSQTNLNQLFQSAVDEGNLSAAAASIVGIPDLGQQIQAGLCPVIDDVEASEVTLVAMLIDDSSSISRIPNGPQAVCAGQNVVIEALQGSKQKDGILVGTWRMNQDEPVHPFVPLDQAVLMENGVNYEAYGETPLYRKSVMVLGTVSAEVQRFYDDYFVPARAVFIVVTDGHDEDYSATKTYTASDVATLIESLQENIIVQFMGIQSTRVNFHRIAGEMGVMSKWVLTPDNNESEIRKAFQLASQSAVRASQSAASFSQTAQAGGFGV